MRKADEVERWYRRFLFLNFKHRDRSIVPTKTIDQFWHQHILDTQKYAADCEKIFGFFLHHFPYFGVRGEDDAVQLRDAFLETRQIFRSEFGEELPLEVSGSAECDSSSCDDPPNCGSSCSGTATT